MVNGNGNLLIFWEVEVINPPQIWLDLETIFFTCLLYGMYSSAWKWPVLKNSLWSNCVQQQEMVLRFGFGESSVLRCFQNWQTYTFQNNGMPKFKNFISSHGSKDQQATNCTTHFPTHLSHRRSFFTLMIFEALSEAVRAWARPHFQKAPNLTRIFFRPNFNSKLKMWTEILLNEQWLLCFALKKAQVFY